MQSEEIKEIVASKPDLSPEEQVVADKITPHLRLVITAEVRKDLEVENIKHRKDFDDQLREENKKMIDEAIKEWKAAQEPPNKEEITSLLTQEYPEFSFTVKLRDKTTRDFVLMELPRSAEDRFLEVLKKKGTPALKELVSAEFKLDGTADEQLVAILQSAEAVMDVATELVMICIDPFGEENITKDWISKHMSTYRLVAVILNQVALNKYRDFLSQGSHIRKLIQRTTM